MYLLFGLYHKYCVENILNDSIMIRPVRKENFSNTICKYCFYYKHCLIFNASIALADAVLGAYLKLDIHFSCCEEIF